ncbi:hypothetical protein GNE08_29665 (plasmid) [Trichormus variabilis ARAD]|uniref:Uncharacterized protein n=1 Tax=Trichormus variabilis N2B TaxID=2681315 RepID=A0ABR6SHJ7_ANAVA|nr:MULTISPECIES: hypothetical protein [Nostocaceae]MBC1218341.1 hypothetical protein [Trichormus variabilis ARAD]MBC1259627.1 hypothetical protein [Trichormus variabilis V5]MBC1271133.1 hypothetical protein [Trichormus variabilis FSR]MBC1305854.1 hypothetical protein [Trichormus variabilis N2B]MBC1314895.1 hypothetical protein [Trichormus variabilis PNB]
MIKKYFQPNNNWKFYDIVVDAAIALGATEQERCETMRLSRDSCSGVNGLE